MFKKIKETKNLPPEPYLIWDGNCGFCKYWKTNWQKKVKNKVVFKTYQETADFFNDIPLKEFKKSSKLIEPSGKIYNGPDSAYRILYHANKPYWHQLYQNSSTFRWLSDHAYNHIAKNRSFYYKLTIFCFGKNPLKLKLYFLLYILLFAVLLFISI